MFVLLACKVRARKNLGRTEQAALVGLKCVNGSANEDVAPAAPSTSLHAVACSNIHDRIHYLNMELAHHGNDASAASMRYP